MKKDNFGDWRIQAVTTLAQDIPAAYPGGPSHKTGTPVYLTSSAKHEEHNVIGFITPNAPALALNVALRSAEKANNLKKTIVMRNVATPYGSGKSVANEHLPHLYDFFEQCMSSVIFSYQALECYCNSIIVSYAKEPIEVKRRKKRMYLSPKDVERQLSTEEKVDIVVPKLLKVRSPKGKEYWKGFKTLKQVRDASIHLKSHDMYNANGIDNESLFFYFFNNDPLLFPQTSFGLINYFLESEGISRWAEHFKEKIAFKHK